MFKYTLRRILVAVPMLLGAMSIVFFAMRILPGDPCLAMMGDQATTEALADCTKNLGLQRPLTVQYVDYLWRSIRLDFGQSFRQGYPVNEYIARMFPHTLVLVLASAVVAALIGIPIGIVSALKRRSPLIDYPLRIIALLGLSMPVFWLGILLLIVFSLRLDIFPLIGGGDLDGVIQMLRTGEAFTYPRDFLAAVGDVLYHLALPAFALGFTLAATVSRLARSAMLEVISQDYIRTARAKGQGERAVVYKHAFRNMMVPLLTIIGLFVAIALTGTVLTETVFTRPGLGKMLVDAIGARDYPLAQGAITVFTMIIIVVNLVVDLAYAIVDPRITYR
ncbi:MAG TPA: ABC transporter permease [Candidatus Deferrimicrobiaceae bacterium]|jgi:ABC-type dipeptide/oligopeptide/nickel transport system permease component|nr:ABC transporter permease [Candidatus Deferrimicrobiaceae bacterium]